VVIWHFACQRYSQTVYFDWCLIPCTFSKFVSLRPHTAAAQHTSNTAAFTSADRITSLSPHVQICIFSTFNFRIRKLLMQASFAMDIFYLIWREYMMNIIAFFKCWNVCIFVPDWVADIQQFATSLCMPHRSVVKCTHQAIAIANGSNAVSVTAWRSPFIIHGTALPTHHVASRLIKNTGAERWHGWTHHYATTRQMWCICR